jgi:hypothetical protein
MALRATRRPWSVIAIEAAGKARAAMASVRIAKASEKVLSWCSKAGSRAEEGGIVLFRVRALSVRNFDLSGL